MTKGPVNPILAKAILSKTGVDINGFISEMTTSISELKVCHDLAAELVGDVVHLRFHQPRTASDSMRGMADYTQLDADENQTYGDCLYRMLQYLVAVQVPDGLAVVEKLKKRWNCE